MSDYDPDELDATHVPPYGIRVTTPEGTEVEFEVPEMGRSMNLNDILELSREKVARNGVEEFETGRWYGEQVEEEYGVNPDDEDVSSFDPRL